MAQVQESGVRRLRMSYDEWLAVSDEFRSEWVDGEVLLMPPVSGPHSKATFELMVVLTRDLHDVELYMDVGVRMPRNRVRAPDIMAVTRPVVEGFADEKGTPQYNMELGQKRAEAVRAYLAAKGVPPARMKAKSFGNSPERKVKSCDDISCWSQNRRAVTVLVTDVET